MQPGASGAACLAKLLELIPFFADVPDARFERMRGSSSDVLPAESKSSNGIRQENGNSAPCRHLFLRTGKNGILVRSTGSSALVHKPN